MSKKYKSSPSNMSRPPSWECPACTYVNDNGAGLACEMCRTERRRPPPASRRHHPRAIKRRRIDGRRPEEDGGSSSSRDGGPPRDDSPPLPPSSNLRRDRRQGTDDLAEEESRGGGSDRRDPPPIVDLGDDDDDDDDEDEGDGDRRHPRTGIEAHSDVDDVTPPESDRALPPPPIEGARGGWDRPEGGAVDRDVAEAVPSSRGADPTECRSAGCDVGNAADSDATCLRPAAAAADDVPPGGKEDLCRTCGADLARFVALKGRIAHAKRCHAKYGLGLFGGGRERDGGSTGATEWEYDATDVASDDRHLDRGGEGWHEDACADRRPDLVGTAAVGDDAGTNRTWPVGRFLDAAAPTARTMTSVLMAGARRVAKFGAIVSASKKSATTTTKASKPGGRQSNRGGGNWVSSDYRRNGRCPAYKRITGTDFICDGFQYACKALSENYFLTHFHCDHYGGISKGWNDGIIYCSVPTAYLVNQQLGVDKKYLHPLPMNTPTVIASKGKPVTVTLLDANHCPGAVLFLFEVGSRSILHVGDFRWDRELMMQAPQLRAFGKSSPRLDEIFLDTTYCDEKYTLPTQEDAISAAIEVATKEMEISRREKSMKTLFLFGSYTIGKEKIYMSVAESLKLKVYVDSWRYRILSQLFTKERMRLFTTNKSDTNLWVVPLGSVNFKQMNDYMEEGNKNKVFTQPYGRVVGFRPTGWTYSAEDKKQRKLPCARSKPGRNLITSKTSGRFSVHGVPYSEHSSFPELVDCLACLKPVKIIPTVSVSKSEEQVELLLNKLHGKNT